MSENDDSLPRLLGGRYQLEAKLGSGGMGVVYRATDLTMQRSVAVKLIRAVDGVALDEEVAGRFLREAKNTARVQHENIIEVYDLGRSDQGDMFFVMELLEGESLSAKLRRDGKLPVAVSVHIARQMCAALHVAHAAGIIHRDLKPANVMLIRRAGQDDYVKVLDFGVAKSYTPDQQTQLTHTGMLVGTVEYMAPEQIMGRKVDGRTDIYALGVVLYRMLSGKAPFRDGGVPALINAHLNVFPKPMTETTPEIPGALDRVVLRCLAKQPEQRYESMEEVSRALSGAIETTDLGLVSLEYQGDDPYQIGDKTEVARPARESRPDPAAIRLDDAYDDATIKLERVEGGSGPASRKPARPAPVAVPSPPSPSSPPRSGRGEHAPPSPSSPPRSGRREHAPEAVPAVDRTAVMSREESTAKRAVPEEVARYERAAPRECAMCRTMNPPYSRACNACGVSLAREEQEAVRARVVAPRAAQPSGPQFPQAASAAYPAPSSGPPYGHAPMPGGHGPHAPHGQQPLSHGVPSGAWGTAPPDFQAPPPPSAWERFLQWTGLRGR